MTDQQLKQTIAAIRHEFFAYRNGIVADALRKGGDPHRLIMGCQLIDVMTIARQQEPSVELASALWADKDSRECRMIAPMLMPVGECDATTAEAWAADAECPEIADLLCHRLLRRMPFAPQLLRTLLAYDQPRVRYVAFRLMLNLLIMGTIEPTGNFKALAEAELSTATTPAMQQLLQSILQEF